MVDLALNSKLADFKDGLQYYTPRENKINILVTKNIKDDKEKALLVITAEEYLKLMNTRKV